MTYILFSACARLWMCVRALCLSWYLCLLNINKYVCMHVKSFWWPTVLWRRECRRCGSAEFLTQQQWIVVRFIAFVSCRAAPAPALSPTLSTSQRLCSNNIRETYCACAAARRIDDMAGVKGICTVGWVDEWLKESNCFGDLIHF